MRRREFISVIVGATAWSLRARAAHSAMPVVGVLSPVTLDQHLHAAFRQGLAEADYVDGKNVVIEVLVSETAGDLIRRNVSVIFAAVPDAVVAARDAGHSGHRSSRTNQARVMGTRPKLPEADPIPGDLVILQRTAQNMTAWLATSATLE
jgi:hypothetical protein